MNVVDTFCKRASNENIILKKNCTLKSVHLEKIFSVYYKTLSKCIQKKYDAKHKPFRMKRLNKISYEYSETKRYAKKNETLSPLLNKRLLHYYKKS